VQFPINPAIVPLFWQWLPSSSFVQLGFMEQLSPVYPFMQLQAQLLVVPMGYPPFKQTAPCAPFKQI